MILKILAVLFTWTAAIVIGYAAALALMAGDIVLAAAYAIVALLLFWVGLQAVG